MNILVQTYILCELKRICCCSAIAALSQTNRPLSKCFKSCFGQRILSILMDCLPICQINVFVILAIQNRGFTAQSWAKDTWIVLRLCALDNMMPRIYKISPYLCTYHGIQGCIAYMWGTFRKQPFSNVIIHLPAHHFFVKYAIWRF